MAKQWQIHPRGDGTGVPRYWWPVIGAVLFAVVIAIVYLIASVWGY